MYRRLFMALICLTAAVSVKAQLYEYRNPYGREYWRRNIREEFLTYRNLKQAWSGTRDSLENATILSGVWKMKMTSDTAAAVRTSDLSGWESVTVPSFKSDIKSPSFTPKSLPVMEEPLKMQPAGQFAVFRTDAIVKFDYIDKALFLHVGAVSGKTTVYVNGRKVAVLWESFIPYDIRITQNVVRGRNSVALVVEPYNPESVLERWSRQLYPCIPGEVYLFAQPKIRMFDFIHKTTLDPTYKNGLLEAAVILKTELINTHNVTVYYDLYDMNGRIVNSDYKHVDIGWYIYDTIRFVSSIQNVNLWHAKNPYLYTIVYRVKRDGRTLENIVRKVGYRQVEVKGDSLLINGKREPIYGTNADLYPELVSSCCSRARIEEILKGLKAQGFNAVRTPYPLRKEFYDAADKLGIYVSETAPICSRGLSKSPYKGGTLANNPAWDSAYIARVVDTYEKGKDHTSIIMWEMGEDAGNGYCFCNAYQAIRALEQYRPISYSGAGYQWISDVCMDNREKPNGRKPYIPSRMKYDSGFWDENQGGFLDEVISGRVANSDYTESTMVVENVRPVDEVQDAEDVEEQPAKGKKFQLWKKKKKTAATEAEAETANAAAAQTQAVSVPAAVATTAAQGLVQGQVTATKTSETSITIYNGLDCNLSKYNIIHGVESNGSIEPVEMFSVDIEPGGSKTVTVTKTSKKKKAYLLVGGIAKIEL